MSLSRQEAGGREDKMKRTNDTNNDTSQSDMILRLLSQIIIIQPRNNIYGSEQKVEKIIFSLRNRKFYNQEKFS